MTAVTTSFQLATLAVMVVTGLVALIGVRRWQPYRGVFIPVGIVALAHVVYYVTLLAGRLSGAEVLLWGAALRFVTAAIVLGASVALAWALGGKHDK